MNIWRSTIAASLTAFVLVGCAPLQSIPSMPADLATAETTQQDLKDAQDRTLWGVYTELPGQKRTSTRAGGTTISWQWIRPGWVLEESWHTKNISSPTNTFTLWRGELPGQIYSRTSGLLSMAWDGQVQANGSVLFKGAGLLSFPFQVELLANDVLELRGATIENGLLVSLAEVQPTDRYIQYKIPSASTTVLTASAPVGAQSALKPSTPNTVSTPAAATGTQQNKPAEASSSQNQEQSPVAKARIDAATAANTALVSAQQALNSAKQETAQAQTAAEQAESALKALTAMEASTKPVPKSAGKPGDFWSYCWYGVLSPYGETTQIYVTNMINQRMWDGAFPTTSARAVEEFKAYDGPNTPRRVKQRFKNAIERSGLLPEHPAYSLDCSNHVSFRTARSYYDDWRHNDPKPTYVMWKSLESEHLEGSMKLPTREEAARIKREAQEAKIRLKTAQDAVKRQEQIVARQQEAAQRAQDCAAGVASACGARGTKN